MHSATPRTRTHRPAALAAGVTALLTTLVTACSAGGSGDGATAAGGPPRDGGTLRLAVAKEPECLDPHQSPTEAARLLSRPILDSLVHQTAKGAFEPWLAKSWTISPDGRTYTFTLRDDVSFTDGAKFDAAAVVANLNHVVAPATKSLLASSLISAYKSARAVDAHTAEVTLKQPDSGFLGALALPNLGIESPVTLEGSTAALCKKIVGTGPFRTTGGLVAQKGIDYTKNPAYDWAPKSAGHTGPAHLDGIKVQIVPDNASRSGALTSGQVDAATGLDPTSTKTLAKTPGFALHKTSFPGANYSYWPNTAEGPLADVSVRKALRAGIDWSTIDQRVNFGQYPSAKGPLSTTTPGYDGSQASAYAYDPAEAARLLDAAGWTGRDAKGYRTKNGKRLRVEHLWSDPSVTNLAVQIQAAAKKLGVEFVEENVDGGTFVKRLLAGDYDIIDTSFSSPGPDVLRVLFGKENIPTPARGVSNNMARYDNPAVEQLFTQARHATDQKEQFRLYGEVQRHITDDAAVLPIYSPVSTFAARTAVQGTGFTADGSADLYAIWLAS
ncbi:ABC transporter substrate-binding protein [Streptomyces sp. SID8381]|uniref:ABC transporter substrate-binding protein n=1 Tax=unclassified Streptomyces TaxID=2593676 RepID=UPI00039B98BF|nr:MULTISPECIES: ABC transporter substrate-binding protein [unclassified Streptomyces]MYX30312.1 ABC transporter substrate-binding protein [Streptomyces sp. SID8381]